MAAPQVKLIDKALLCNCNDELYDMVLPRYTFGDFHPMVAPYYLDGYTNDILPKHIYENYDEMRERRSPEMPLPTLSVGFILMELDPRTEQELAMGYPCLSLEQFSMFAFRFTVCHVFSLHALDARLMRSVDFYGALLYRR